MTCEIGMLTGELSWSMGESQAKLKFTETDDGITLETIVVPAECRGKGCGGSLLRYLIEYSGLRKKDIQLSARPIGGGTSPERLERLVRFYEKYGFVEVERGVTVCKMVRSRSNGDGGG
jgi:ribosomal protein S18 acetylase RimI-like enzyme